jgi:hypothetical protein
MARLLIMRTILLTPYQNKIDREYLSSEEVTALCDTKDGAFTVTMPDSETSDSVVINVVNIGVNILTVTAINRQNINDSLLFTLKQWNVIRLVAFENKWIVISGNVTEKAKFTADGGLAILMTNRTGGVSVKGEIVTPSAIYSNAVSKIIIDVPNPIGVFYESGIADGTDAWVVVSGIADVYFVGNTTRGQLGRGFVTGDAGYVSGQAIAENFPTAPFATDKHFYEICHITESRTGAGLAKGVLHFN